MTALAVSPNGRHVVSGGGDGRVRLWTFVEVGVVSVELIRCDPWFDPRLEKAHPVSTGLPNE